MGFPNYDFILFWFFWMYNNTYNEIKDEFDSDFKNNNYELDDIIVQDQNKIKKIV